MSGQNVQDHYSGEETGSGMAARILAALRSVNGSDAAVTPEALAPLDHFNARGVAATQELVALLEPQTGETILDIGSGIGGPARWIVARHGCTVTGVDITPAFCDAARELNAACDMTDRVTIFEGSATALPLSDASFDRAYSHARRRVLPTRPGSAGRRSVSSNQVAGWCYFSIMPARTGSRIFLCPGRQCRKTAFWRLTRRPDRT